MAVRLKVFTIYSGFVDNMKGTVARIEISIRSGIPTFDVIGLCDSSVKECRERVRSAIISSGYNMPKGHVTVNISPAYIRKGGTCFDLAIALGILFVSGQIRTGTDKRIYAEGELSLSGDVRCTPGGALRLIAASNEGFEYIILPQGASMAASGAGVSAMCIKDLYDAACIFAGGAYEPLKFDPSDLCEVIPKIDDLSCVRGQEKAKRAILIAAAGRHNLMLLGSPGCGKTMAARLAAGIMPPMTSKEISEVFSLNEAVASSDELTRPFRYIHPGITPTMLLGSSRSQRPGECVMANNGILFADEISEFPPSILDLLRVPLEERRVYVKSGDSKNALPASFVFIGAGNPCRCGNLFERDKRCTCTPMIRRRYMTRFSGPFIDRIDLFTEMRSLSEDELQKTIERNSGDESIKLREMVQRACFMQYERYGEGICNGFAGDVDEDLLRASSDVVGMALRISASDGCSARGFSRLLRVGRTIADLDGRDDMKVTDITEASLFRRNVLTQTD